MAVDMTVYDREKAFAAIRECREQIRQGTAAMWLNAAYAANRGATLAQIAEAVGVPVGVAAAQLKRVRGRTHGS